MTTSKRIKSSVFMITVNTNKGKYDDIMKNQFEKVLYKLLNEENLKQMIIFNSGTYNDIKSIESELAVEVGGIYKKLHAHLPIQIKHTANIKLNIKFINEYIKKQMDIKEKIHIDIKATNNSFQTFIDYAKKYHS